MKTKQEIRDLILENCANKDRNIDISELDSSDFSGDTRTNFMKVRQNLYQLGHKVMKWIITRLIPALIFFSIAGGLVYLDLIIKAQVWTDHNKVVVVFCLIIPIIFVASIPASIGVVILIEPVEQPKKEIK